MKPRGTTLIELIVSIAILGVLAGVTTLAINGLRPRISVSENSIMQARMRAIRSGVAIRLSVVHAESGPPMILLFLPDGRIVGDDSADSAGQSQ